MCQSDSQAIRWPDNLPAPDHVQQREVEDRSRPSEPAAPPAALGTAAVSAPVIVVPVAPTPKPTRSAARRCGVQGVEEPS